MAELVQDLWSEPSFQYWGWICASHISLLALLMSDFNKSKKMCPLCLFPLPSKKSLGPSSKINNFIFLVCREPDMYQGSMLVEGSLRKESGREVNCDANLTKHRTAPRISRPSGFPVLGWAFISLPGSVWAQGSPCRACGKAALC